MREVRSSRRGNLLVMSLATVLVACLLALAGKTETQAAKRPNMVFILTDDLDTRSISKLSGLRQVTMEHGMAFRNFFATTSLCCPSRASIFRGQYAHNTGITSNTSPRGGAQVFRKKGLDKNTFATRLRRSGYETAFFGDYMNEYDKTPRYVPPGWTQWHAFAGNDVINHNGKIERNAFKSGTSTDYLRGRASRYIRNNNFSARPLFLEINTRDPHEPAHPPARYEDAFKGEPLPRTPNFNEKNVSDKPAWIRKRSRLSDDRIRAMTKLYRDRLRTMLAVEDLYRKIIESLRKKNQLDNTYIFFTSDQGYHLGAHRLLPGKWTAYEEDTQVPFIVRGPGIKPGSSSHEIALNTDLAPTFSDIANAPNPDFVDGRSLLPVLRGRRGISRTAYLQEDKAAAGVRRPALNGVRTASHSYIEYASGEKELYNVKDDQYQLHNRYKTARQDLIARLERRLDQLLGCAGKDCRTAENG